jgi:hypothetical protein
MILCTWKRRHISCVFRPETYSTCLSSCRNVEIQKLFLSWCQHYCWLFPAAICNTLGQNACTRCGMNTQSFQSTKKILTPCCRVLLEKLIVCSASQEIPHRVWNWKVHYCVHKLLILVSIMSKNESNPHSNPISQRSILILSCHLCVSLPNGLSFRLCNHNFV